MDFQNKTALITGGSKGIGLAVARNLVARGVHVWILARNEEVLQSATLKLEEGRVNPGQTIGCIKADVADREGLFKAIAGVQNRMITPDILINCAGVVHPGCIEELDSAKFHWMMNVNYFGTVNTIQAVLPRMIARGNGVIVNVASSAGFIGIYGYSAYAGSKFAVRGFSDVLRAELKPKGIRVLIVFPPDTKTDQLEYEEKFKPVITRELTAGGGLLTPEQVATTIVKAIHGRGYIVTPGFENALIYFANSFLGSLIYSLMDIMIEKARKKTIPAELRNEGKKPL